MKKMDVATEFASSYSTNQEHAQARVETDVNIQLTESDSVSILKQKYNPVKKSRTEIDFILLKAEKKNKNKLLPKKKKKERKILVRSK